jgi:hypothetical protein
MTGKPGSADGREADSSIGSAQFHDQAAHATNTMQCGTYHDPHNDGNTNYLRQPNNTAHCTTCHL